MIKVFTLKRGAQNTRHTKCEDLGSFQGSHKVYPAMVAVQLH